MPRRLEVEIIGDPRSLERAFGRAGRATGSFGASLGKAARVAGAALAAVSLAGGIAGGKMIDLAGDAAEVESKFQVVFGREMPRMVKNLDAFSRATGASRYELRQQTADMGALLEPLTASKKAAGDLSIQFVQLATDLSSFNNVPVEDALLAIRSGLVGEAEPLRRFGVLLNEAAVKAEAYRSGIAKAGAELTEQQKVQARANLIMQQTKLAQGDAERTSGSWANQLRRLKNSVRDLATDAGKVLLPAMTGIVSFLNASVIPAFGRAFDFVRGFWSRISTQLSEAPDLRAKAKIVWEGLEEAAQSIATKVADAMPNVDWAATGRAIADGITASIKPTAELALKLAKIIGDTFDRINWIELGKKAGPFLAVMLVTAFTTLADPGFWIKNWELTLSVALVVFRAKIAEFAVKALAAAFAPISRLVGGIMDDFANFLRVFFPRVGPVLIAVVGAIFRALAGTVGRLWVVVERALAAVWNKLPGVLKTILTGGFVFALASAIQQFAQAAARKAMEIYRWGVDIANALISGLSVGIRAGIDAIKGAIDWVVDKIPGFIKGPLGISSPSKVTIDIGKAIAEGLGVGFDQGSVTLPEKLADRVNAAIQAMISAVQARRSAFAAAVSELTSQALSAFDRLTSEFETKTERKMRREDELRAKRDRQRALAEARTQLAEATVGGDPEAILQAERNVQEALFQIQRAADEKRAERERMVYEDRRARDRRRFENELAELAKQAERRGLSAEAMHQRLLAIFRKYEIPFRNASLSLGSALAEGLKEAAVLVERMAEQVRDAILKHLSNISVNVRVNVTSSGSPPKRQHGGPVGRGHPYVVGEAGPELFVPRSAGMILPAPQTQSMLAGAPTVHIEHYYAQSDRDPHLIASAVARRLAFR